MPMTMTQKILAQAAGLKSVSSGQLIMADLSLVLANDITAPVAINEFEKAGFTNVFNKNKIALVMDHSMPNKDIKSAELCKQCRTFAGNQEIEHFYDVGRMGIEHALLPEQGIVAPGDVIIGADSHTCTYGAIGAFSTGVGSTDVAGGMAIGKAWFKVPGGLKFNLSGKFQPGVSGKDLILHIIGMIGVDGALYKSMEYVGSGVANLTIDDRFTICNMAIEAGAKNGIFPVDAITQKFLKGRLNRPYTAYTADEDAEYEQVFDIDLSSIPPTVACPHLPSNTKPANQLGDIKVDQVVIGSCTNGWLADLEVAANILKGKHIAPGVRCIVFPSTPTIYKQAIKKGYMDIFIDAGCAVSTPTCGPCLGGHMGVLAENEVAIATTNRNFVGRMGHPTSKVYLASPFVAAQSALTGYITDGKGSKNHA